MKGLGKSFVCTRLMKRYSHSGQSSATPRLQEMIETYSLMLHLMCTLIMCKLAQCEPWKVPQKRSDHFAFRLPTSFEPHVWDSSVYKYIYDYPRYLGIDSELASISTQCSDYVTQSASMHYT